MPAVVLLIIIVVVALLVLKSVHDARTRSTAGSGDGHRTTSSRPRSGKSPRHSSAQSAAPPREVDYEALNAHVAKLREAVAQGLISVDEAAASVTRQTDGGLSEGAARKLLDIEDEAA